MIKPSSIEPDVELRDAITGHVVVDTGGEVMKPVAVYGDWERPTNELPDDFLTVFINGEPGGVGMDTQYAKGFIAVSLYCKLNPDGTIKKNRIKRILTQFDEIIEKKLTTNYFFEYDKDRFITPTTPNSSSGYSVTTLNLKWHTATKQSNA